MTKKKRKKKLVKVKISRKEKSSRLIIKGKPIIGINSHGMYESKRTLHIHLGEKRKIVLYPKDLIGIWTKKGKKYVRTFPKDTKKRKRRREEKRNRES